MASQEQLKEHPNIKKVVSLESFIFMAGFAVMFGVLGTKMGAINMLNTMMQTAYQLLMDTVFYIMAIAVLAGALSGLFTEFGVVAIINKILSPLMKPLYDLPGASVVGFRRYFKRYQLPALTNIGTAFGMGLIITSFMIGITSPSGESFIGSALIGNLGAIVGSIVSVRLMLMFTAKEYGKTEMCEVEGINAVMYTDYRMVRPGSAASRFMSAMLDGGKSGVSMGVAVIPGVLIICTFVMMLTNGPSEAGTYTGAAYEGIALLPALGDKLDFILKPLFGFTSSQGVSVPITSLGAAGAAIGLVPKLVRDGMATGNDVAVFTAMCMCWSGYLSTHVAMMDSLGYSKMTGKAIISHTIGGLCAGVAAHWIYVLFSMIG